MWNKRTENLLAILYAVIDKQFFSLGTKSQEGKKKFL